MSDQIRVGQYNGSIVAISTNDTLGQHSFDPARELIELADGPCHHVSSCTAVVGKTELLPSSVRRTT